MGISRYNINKEVSKTRILDENDKLVKNVTIS